VRYIDGEDKAELAAALCEWDQDSQLREKMTDRGFLRAAKFSWDRCARETARVYERVLQ
jgi:alpha-1,3-rhamnosyl/mannosyltransferase